MSAPESNDVETASAFSVGVIDEQQLSQDQFIDTDFLPLYSGHVPVYALTPEACQEKLSCTRPEGHCCFLSDWDKTPLKAYSVTYNKTTGLFKCSYQGDSSVSVGPKRHGESEVESGAFQTGFAYELDEDGETQEEPAHNKALWRFDVARNHETLTGKHSKPRPISGAINNDTLNVACAQSCGYYNDSGYTLVQWEATIKDGCRAEECSGSTIYERCQESVYLQTERINMYLPAGSIDKTRGYRWDAKERQAECSSKPDDKIRWEWSPQQSWSHPDSS